jgi:hypothetical protein
VNVCGVQAPAAAAVSAARDAQCVVIATVAAVNTCLQEVRHTVRETPVLDAVLASTDCVWARCLTDTWLSAMLSLLLL